MYKENTYWSTISCHKSKNWAILNSICASKAPKKQLTKICRMKWIFYHSRAMLANNWQETKINLLKVSQSRKQFLEFSILPKNERKTKKISSELSGYFFFSVLRLFLEELRIPTIFVKKYWALVVLNNSVLLSRPFWIFFSKKIFIFASLKIRKHL